ncbi:MAG TPA: ATP-binding protein [Longimicrobiales bacterium]
MPALSATAVLLIGAVLAAAMAAALGYALRLNRRLRRLERERLRLLRIARQSRIAAGRQFRYEEALRGIARTFATTFDIGAVLTAIAESVKQIARADAAYVERLRGRREAEIAAVAGRGAPPVHTRVPYPGSLTEGAMRQRRPEILGDVAIMSPRIARILRRSCGHCRVLVAPLFSEDEAVGALVLLRRGERPAFAPGDVARIDFLAGLASFVLRRGLLVQEIEERRRQAEANQERYRSLFELNPDAAFSFDTHGVCTSANPATERLLGYPARRLIGRRFTPVVPPAYRARVWDAFYRALRGEPQRIEIEIQRRGGERRHVLARLVPMIEAGRTVGVFGIAEDITDQRRTERQLDAARAEAERRAHEEAALRRAAEAMATAFTDDEVMRAVAEGALVATGADGAFVELVVSGGRELEVAATAGEWTPEEGTRMPLAGSLAEQIIQRGRPLAVPRVRDIRDRVVAPGFAERCADCELLGVPHVDTTAPAGVLLLIRAPGRPRFTPEQSARATTFSRIASLAFRKIRLLQDLRRRSEELERVLESRSRLVRGFSHDVKNPIGAADGYAALLEDGLFGPLQPRQAESVRRIRRALRSAISLIDDLVDIARTEAGEIEIEHKPTDVLAISRDAAEEHRAQAEAAGLELVVEGPPEVRPVLADPGRVRQILGNLLSNAVKYTPRGGRISIRVSTRSAGPDGAPGEWLAVEVADTGPGIPAELQEQIFHEFVRFGPGATRGAGLGLAISRLLARRMGGDITLDSAPGRGSTFTLWLPAPSAAAEPGTRAPATTGAVLADGTIPQRTPRRGPWLGGTGAESSALDGGTGRQTPVAPPAPRSSRPARPGPPELYELLVRSITDVGIYALDPDGRIITWNEGAERITGYRPDDVLGRHIAILHAPDQAGREEADRVLRLATEHGRHAGEGWRFRADGSRFWARDVLASLHDSTGHLIGYSGLLRDCTEEKRRDAARRFLLEASRVLGSSLDYRTTLRSVARLAVPAVADIAAVYAFEDHTPMRLEIVHATGETLRITREIERRYPGEALRLRPAIEIARQGEPFLASDVTDDMLRAAAIDEGHLALLRQLGLRSIMLLPLRSRGRILGAIILMATQGRPRYTESDLALAEDLARRAALAVDNARLYEAAVVASRTQADFLAIMSHELRAPLTAILGYADLLLEGIPTPLPPAARAQVERIVASAQHLRELIDDILSYSRIEAGRQEVVLARTDLRHELSRIAQIAAPMATEKGLRFHYEPPEDAIILETDPEKLRRLLIHLVSNAVKFTDRGEVELSVRRENDDALIDVRDTGIGIAPEHLERVFEPFWQVEEPTTRRAPGTGLGLTLARRLARLLGGDITVSSAPGKGSTFTVRLPVRSGRERARQT